MVYNQNMGIPRVTNPQAKSFIEAFLANRLINREIYKRVPEDQFDYRMVNTPNRKSDSPRESLGHQIGVQKDYMNGVIHGELSFVSGDDKALKALSKTELLNKLGEIDEGLVELLSKSDIGERTIKVPWSKTPIPAISSLWAMNSHEILHTGWNLALMDHLDIDRFPALKEMWG